MHNARLPLKGGGARTDLGRNYCRGFFLNTITMRSYFTIFEATGAFLVCLAKGFRTEFLSEFQDVYMLRNVLFGLAFWLPVNLLIYWMFS